MPPSGRSYKPVREGHACFQIPLTGPGTFRLRVGLRGLASAGWPEVNVTERPIHYSYSLMIMGLQKPAPVQPQGPRNVALPL